MDINCPKCGEPWDHDELHYISGAGYEEASRRFARQGCRLFGAAHNPLPDREAAFKSQLLMQLSPYAEDWIGE